MQAAEIEDRFRRIYPIKRTLDYLIGIPLLILSLPIMGILGVLIKIIDPGPVFYVQDRVGYRGRKFKIIKMRTMYINADKALDEYLNENDKAKEEWESYLKLKEDPRILPIIGKFMRRNSLDELPQFWNIIKGDMTLVGPRPFPTYHLEKFSPEFRALRQSFMPGLTGFWQVYARSNGDLKVQQEMDTHYIQNWSLLMDIRILIRTVWTVLSRNGAY
ncbi:MAG: sugar transferase [Bacteroidota bacterium]|nr:sugar transferase [Bacteroidota bacterium]